MLRIDLVFEPTTSPKVRLTNGLSRGAHEGSRRSNFLPDGGGTGGKKEEEEKGWRRVGFGREEQKRKFVSGVTKDCVSGAKYDVDKTKMDPRRKRFLNDPERSKA